MKRWIRLASLALMAMGASAQNTPGVGGGAATNNINPAQVIWGMVAIMGAMGSAWITMSLIWTAMQGATADHEQFHKLPRIAFWAAILFSATFLSGRMALGA